MMSGEQYFLVSELGEMTEVIDHMLVGRNLDCALVLGHALVSRHHAKILVTEQGIVVDDLQSSNGTYVQGARISKERLLCHGDTVSFGPCMFDVIYESAQDAQKVEEEGEGEGEGEGDQGSIVAMPLSQNLPPAWIHERENQTRFYTAADMEKMVSDKGEDEIRKFEAGIDAPTLLILSGDDAGCPYKLQHAGNHGFWTIGKDSTNQELSIVIDDPSVSDFHAKLVYKDGRWKIVDHMSTNHTYVNGEQYNSAFLSSSDSIRFGRVNAVFLLPVLDDTQQQSEKPKNNFFNNIFNKEK